MFHPEVTNGLCRRSFRSSGSWVWPVGDPVSPSHAAWGMAAWVGLTGLIVFASSWVYCIVVVGILALMYIVLSLGQKLLP